MIKPSDQALRAVPKDRPGASVVRAPLLAALLGALVAAAADPGGDPAGKPAPDPVGASVPPIVFTQVPAGAPDGPWLPHDSRIVSHDPAGPEGKLDDLTPGFSAAGRPDVSFDGHRILFIGRRRPTEPAQVWEMGADGSAPRRITSEAGECVAAIYLSPIYTIDADQPAYQVAFCSAAPGTSVCQLSTCRLDGTQRRQITFNPHGASDPFQLSDGRLLFSGGLPSADGTERAGATGLFTVNSDGTDLFPFAVGEPSVVRGMAGETAGGEVVFVESTGAGPGGALVAVSRTASFHSRRVVTADGTGRYRAPAGLGDGHVLVSFRPGREGTYGIHLLDAAGGVRTDLVYDDADWHDVDAVPLRARPEPAGRSSVVNDRADTGLLYCLDASLSDTPGTERIGDGRIRWLQVFTAEDGDGGESRETADSGGVTEKLIGTVKVESDGSFCLEVPARTPLRLQTLDAEQQVLQAMRSWIWVMPKEARGCIGCHEDRELSPPNRHALALRKPPTVVDRAGSPSDAAYERTGDGDR